MNTPITINNVLEIIAVIVAVQGFFKAIEWLIDKLNKKYVKDKQIDENSESLAEYKKKTDKAILDLTTSLATIEKNIRDALAEQKAEYMSKLKEDKDEYLKGIHRVEASILETQAVYQQTVAVVDIKIENLEKSQNAQLEALTRETQKHNSVIERTFILERDVAVLQQRETASEKRLRELEDDKRDKRDKKDE